MDRLPKAPAASLDDRSLEEFAAFLEELLRRAGGVVLPHFRRSIPTDDKRDGQSGYDPVTVADRDAEKAMRAAIRAHYPGHGIFGEEYGFEPGAAGLTWVLDPIDGTRSFIAGMLHWGVVAGLYDGEKAILGGVYQPVVDELFIGDGRAASCSTGGHERKLSVRSCAGLEEAVVCCTHPTEMFAHAAESQAFRAVEKRARLSRYGGDCYLYCLLAMGCVDLCVEASLKPYDIQGVIPVVRGAGGVITTWDGGAPEDGGRIVAAGDPRVHAQALEILAG